MLDIELQDLMFSLLDLGIALLQYFLIMPGFYPLQMALFVLCQYMLEIYDLLLILKGLRVKRLPES